MDKLNVSNIEDTVMIYWVSTEYIPEDMHPQQHDCENLGLHVCGSTYQFSRIAARFELWVKWYFHLQDPVHLHTESRNIHIQTQVYSFISDPPKDALQKHENVHAH